MAETPGKETADRYHNDCREREGGTSHKPPCKMLHSISTRKYPGSAVGGAVLLTEV